MPIHSVFIILLGIAQGVQALEPLPSVSLPSPSCPEELNPFHTSFSHGIDGPVEDGGLKVLWNGSTAEPQSVVVEHTRFPYPALMGVVLEYQGQRYRLVNVGPRLLFEDKEALDREVEAKVKNLEEPVNLQVLPRGRRKQAHQWISDVRHLIQNKVLQQYSESKAYLNQRDWLGLVVERNTTNMDSDIYILLEGEEWDPESLQLEDIERQTLLTLQVSRASPYNPQVPNVVISKTRGFTEDLINQLPFIYRLRGARRLMWYQRQLDRLARSGPVGEITRYVRFGRVPRPIHDYFLWNMFQSSKKSGLRHLVISVDEVTREVFQRFAFEPWLDLVTGNQEQQMKEFLDLHSTVSTSYARVLSHLKASAERVRVIKP